MDLGDLDDVLDFFESSSDAGPSSKKKSSKNTQPNKYTKPSTNTKSQAGSTGPDSPISPNLALRRQGTQPRASRASQDTIRALVPLFQLPFRLVPATTPRPGLATSFRLPFLLSSTNSTRIPSTPGPTTPIRPSFLLILEVH